MAERQPAIMRVTRLLSDARYALRSQQDLPRARELTLEALPLLDGMQAPRVELADVHHRVAALFHDLEDPARCEQFAWRAIELEAALGRPLILGNHHLFFARFLTGQRRLAEAAHHATLGLRHYELGLAADHPELRRLRAEVAAMVRAAQAAPPS